MSWTGLIIFVVFVVVVAVIVGTALRRKQYAEELEDDAPVAPVKRPPSAGKKK